MSAPGDLSLQAELYEVVRVFVGGVLEGLRQMDDLKGVDVEADMVAALMDAAITICLDRGVSTEDLVMAVREHARALRASRAARTAAAN